MRKNHHPWVPAISSYTPYGASDLLLRRDVGLEGHRAFVFAGFGCFLGLLIEIVLRAEALLSLGADDAL